MCAWGPLRLAFFLAGGRAGRWEQPVSQPPSSPAERAHWYFAPSTATGRSVVYG